MKVATLWNGLSGYLNACLQALSSLDGVELFVGRRRAHVAAPYADEQFAWIQQGYAFASEPDAETLLAQLHEFRPDVLIVASWNRPVYREACRQFRNKAIRICCMDNPWEGTARQWLGVATAPIFVQRLFDAAFVAGERQAQFARRLGFAEDRIWRGCLSCDHSRFHAVYRRAPGAAADRHDFLFVGRLAPEKSIDTLLKGFRLYRSRCSRPWGLQIAGEGPLRPEVESEAGVVYRGFLQPEKTPELFSKAGCLVLPSQWEHWGVVLHEAAAAGLLLLCTPECGASVHLLQDGYNGFLFAKKNPLALAEAMQRITQLSRDVRQTMSSASVRQSLQFTPERWAQCIYGNSLRLLNKSAV